jgi:hypothetical protein
VTAPNAFGDAVPRGRYDRPLIIPVGGGELVPYTRASGLADEIAGGGQGLTIWAKRNVALGIARNEDLAAMAAGLEYGDKKLDEIIETAITRVDHKAAWGTAVHSLTEGPEPSPFAPKRMQPDVSAYYTELKRCGLTSVASELFVVNDELRVAGTFDDVYHHPLDGYKVGDKKTGKKKPLNVMVQLAVYAGGFLYDPATGARTPLGVRRDKGLLAHIPKGEGAAEFFDVDLMLGRDLALFCAAIRDAKPLFRQLERYGPPLEEAA